MATLLHRAQCPHVHAQTPLLTLLSHLLSPAPPKESLGEVSEVKPQFYSLQGARECRCVQVYRLTGSEKSSLMGKLGLRYCNPTSDPFLPGKLLPQSLPSFRGDSKALGKGEPLPPICPYVRQPLPLTPSRGGFCCCVQVPILCVPHVCPLSTFLLLL